MESEDESMICNITTSYNYKKYCKKRKCGLYPCSQLLQAHRKTLGEVAIIRRGNP